MDFEANQVDLTGCEVVDGAGHLVGHVAVVELDEWTGRPEWVRVDLRPQWDEQVIVPASDCQVITEGTRKAVRLTAAS